VLASQAPSVVPTVPTLSVQVERGRAALKVIARTAEAVPRVHVEATFSGGPASISLRLTLAGDTHTYSHEALARHPALVAVLRLIADEAEYSKLGQEELLAFLCGSLLVYARRITTAVPLPRWGRPLRDSRVERALELLNADIAKRWTVELLARAVGLSRPAFARQFLRVLGLSPMRYLTERRMQLAASLLLGSDAALAEVAVRVGYCSEFAFNRAFKRHYRVPPGVFRRQPTRASSALRMAA
jgi:AraC-like DNA-binding protein